MIENPSLGFSTRFFRSWFLQFTALSGRHSILERPLSGAKRPPYLTDCCKLSRVYLNGVMLGRSFHDGIS